MKIVKYDSSLLGQKTITNLEIKVYFLLILTFYTKEQLFQYWEFGRVSGNVGFVNIFLEYIYI